MYRSRQRLRGLKVDKVYVLFRVPLESAETVERPVFCRGLQTFGVIASNLQAHRHVIGRQAMYNFRTLPKALYLFVPEGFARAKRTAHLRGFLNQQADAYVFHWNWRHPYSRMCATGEIPDYEEERHEDYVHSDAGQTWIHDPLTAYFRKNDGHHRLRAKDLCSGARLIDEAFHEYEKTVDSLRHQRIIANELLRFLPFRGKENPASYKNEMYSVSCLHGESDSYVYQLADSLRELAKENGEAEKSFGAHRDETFIYKPFMLGEDDLWLTHSQVSDLERNLLGLGHRVQQDGFEQVIERERNGDYAFFTRAGPQGAHLGADDIYATTVYPELPMAYFIAGMESARPRAQAVGYYQVLEHEVRRREYEGTQGRSKDDLKALKSLVEDKALISDRVFRRIIDEAFPDSDETAAYFVGKKGAVRRHEVAVHLYKRMRNPTVHAGGFGGSRADAVIKPYSEDEFSEEFAHAVSLAKEIARCLVGIRGSPAGVLNDDEGGE